MSKVDSDLVLAFNRASALGRALEHEAAERAFAALLARVAQPGAVASEEFVATARMRRAYCLMDMGRYAEARVELEAARASRHALDAEGRYELSFALGNTLGALGELESAFVTLVDAISIAEDLEDYTSRPAQCWMRILAIGVEREDWGFVYDKAKIALNTARLRGIPELEALASAMLA
jgi:tetratricopeptide (TPR) repeat protein